MANVLIVEDNIALHKLLERILMNAGHKVVGFAINGLDAIKEFISHNPYPDIILMDQRMPIMSGIEATKRILSIEPSAKVLFLSADNRMKEAAIASGAVGFLSKPVKNKTLLTTINTVLKEGDSHTRVMEDIT